MHLSNRHVLQSSRHAVQKTSTTSAAAAGIRLVMLGLAGFCFALVADGQTTEADKKEVSSEVDASSVQETGSLTATQDTTASGTEIRRIWRVGANIQGASQPITQLKVTFPVPTDWPEQHVNLYQEEIPTEARNADYRESDGVKQMVATIPRLNPGETVEIHVLMEITVNGVSYPQRTDHLIIPVRPPRDVRMCLKPSKLIESRERSIRKKAIEIIDGIDGPWEQVRAIYDWVTAEIEIVKRSKVVGAAAVLEELRGAEEDLSNLFIAMCRNRGIPARMVWADNGEYAEFYLQDDAGEGRWYPAVLEGKPEFGQMTDPRVIIQKGDNIKVPEKSQRQRFVVEHVNGKTEGPRPRVRFLRDILPSRDAK